MRDSQVLYQGTAKTGCGKTHSSHHKTLTPGRVPHVRLTRISCHAALDKDACAAFVKESSIECANATEFQRKSGGAYMGRERRGEAPSKVLRRFNESIRRNTLIRPMYAWGEHGAPVQGLGPCGGLKEFFRSLFGR